MTLLESLLDAIVRLEGDALVMHVGEKPYVVTTSSAMSAYRGPLAWGQVELSSRVLTADAVLGMVNQILSTDQRHALDEFGAVEHEIASPVGVPDRFTVVAARGGEDIWLELRRHAAAVAVAAEAANVPAAALADDTARIAAEAAAAAIGLREPPPPTDRGVHDVAPGAEPPAGSDAAAREDIRVARAPEDATIEERVPVLDEVGEHAPEHVEHIVIPLREPASAEPASSAETIGTVDADQDAELEIVEPEEQGAPTEADVEAMLAATASAMLSSGAGRDAERAAEAGEEPDAALAAGFFEVVSEEEATEAPKQFEDAASVDLASALEDIAPSDLVSTSPTGGRHDVEPVAEGEPAARAEAVPTEVEAPSEQVTLEPAVTIQPAAALEGPATVEAPIASQAEPEPEDAASADVEPEPAVPFEPTFVPIQTTEFAVDQFSATPFATNTHDARADVPTGAAPSEPQPAQPGRAVASGAAASAAPRAAVGTGATVDRPGSGARVDDQVLLQVLHTAAERGASTVYVVAQSKPMVRVDGEISALEGTPVLAPADLERLIGSLAPAKDGVQAPPPEGVEWAAEIPGAGRVRCLTFRDRRGPGIIFRIISARTISADYLNLSSEIRELCAQTDGLVLVTGARGSGKTTLLNSLVDLINRTRSDHVVTVETEVAFLHESQRSFVSQREASEPTAAASSIHTALREDPDVLMVEDVTSPEVALAVLDAADSGRLVLASLTAGSAASAIDALIELLPEARRRDARMTLSLALRGVVSQVLVRKTTGGRTAARELLLNTTQVAPLIVDAKAAEITKALETGQRHGMVPLSDALASLVRAGFVHQAEAVRRAPDRKALLAAFERDGLDTSFAERLA